MEFGGIATESHIPVDGKSMKHMLSKETLSKFIVYVPLRAATRRKQLGYNLLPHQTLPSPAVEAPSRASHARRARAVGGAVSG